MAGAVSEFVAGVSLLPRGLALLLQRRKMFAIGAIPPLITSVLFTLVLVVLFAELDPIVGWLTPFADGWGQGLATAIRVVIGVALVAGSGLLMVIAFSTLTLTLGAPLYDKISESVDSELSHEKRSGAADGRGGEQVPPTPIDEPLATSLARGLRQSLTLIAIAVPVSLVLFLAGFIPVVGQVVVPVISAMFGGWMLCIELIGSSFERRGRIRLADRRAAMRLRRARVLGFAVPTFLLLAIPFVAVLVFPIATAAATILARELLEAGRPAADPRAARS